ncbi:MAG: LemA family protein [Candidatus Brennerbacteria bacterium]|nr:LemA family protein [Candidatus Brennerbacteria bacterium]
MDIAKIIYIILGLAILVIGWLIGVYNRLVTLRFRAKEALSDIDVQFKRRYDLIPNLVEIVKGYMAHEKSVLENVTAARSKISGGTPLERDQAENALSMTLKTLFAVSENYPDLKANANFLDLQRELADTENKIQASRRFYNSAVMDLNTKIETFPTNLIAGTFGFHQEKFFEIENEKEKEPVKVKF